MSVGYFVPALGHDPETGTLFVPDGTPGGLGIHVFDAVTGARLAPMPLTTGGAPTDLLLLRRGTVAVADR